MAARDRNHFAMQAYVLLTTIISVVLFIALGYYIFKDDTNTKKAEQAINDKNTATKTAADAVTKVELLKAWLGRSQMSGAALQSAVTQFSGDKEIDDLMKEYKKDMQHFGQAVPDTDRNYSKLVNYLMDQLRERNIQLQKARQSDEERTKEIESVVKRETGKAEAAEAARARAEAELAKMTADNRAADIAQKKRVMELVDQINKARNDAKDAVEAKNAEITKLVAEKAELTRKNGELVKTINDLQNKDFEYAQGIIVNTIEGGKTGYINLGSDDRLRKGVTFTVISRDETRVLEAPAKATAEVLDVIGPKMARVRIHGGKVPVLYGDQIYSPVWRPGQQTEIAFLGRIDVDGDGKDDRASLRALIMRNGGVVAEDVDAEGFHLDENGNRIPDAEVGAGNQISSNINFLVVQDEFKPILDSEGRLDSRQQRYAAAYKDLQDRAKGLGAQVISPIKLINRLQGESGERTKQLGAGAR